jgi:hypothetical protein
MKVARRKAEEGREDGLDWSAEGIARREDRQTGGQGVSCRQSIAATC